MSKDYENLMDSLTNTPYLDTPLEYFKILDDDVEAGSLRQQLAGGGTVRQNFAEKGSAKIEFDISTELPKQKGSLLLNSRGTFYTANLFTKEGERLNKTFGIREYGDLESAKKAGEAFLEANAKVDSVAIKRGDIVRSFLNYLNNVGEFDGEEKLAPELKKYLSSDPNQIYAEVNNTFKGWREGKFEVAGVDRENIPKEYKKIIDEWRPQTTSKRSVARKNQLVFLDQLNDNTELSVDKAKKLFNKEFTNTPYWGLKTFDQRVNQLTRLKNEGKIPSNAAGTMFKNYGIEKGDRSTWLKRAMGQQFGGNYERLIKAGDVLTKEGKVKDAKRLYNAAEKFFGSGGIFTQLDGNAEHPLSVIYGNKTDSLLKIDSLVKGDLNQFKRVLFDTPLKKLVAEYNSPNVSAARQQEIKAMANARKNFLNFLTSGSFDKGIVSPVEFEFGNTFKVKSNVIPIDKLPDGYDFGQFVTKGEGYRNALIKYGKDFNLMTKKDFVNRKGISDENILKNLQILQDKFDLSKDEQKMLKEVMQGLKGSGTTLKSFAGVDDDTLNVIRKGLGKMSKGLRKVASSPLGRYGIIPVTAVDLALNIPIAAIDLYKGVPLKEVGGNFIYQDVLEDVNPFKGESGKGLVIPGTTERSWYEQNYPEALPLYDLEKSRDELRDSAEFFARTDPRKIEANPDTFKQKQKRFEEQKELYLDQYEKFMSKDPKELLKISQVSEQADIARQKLMDTPYLERNGSSQKQTKDNFFGTTIPTEQFVQNPVLNFDKGGRVGYQEAGLVEKLGRGAQALDPRNVPYYAAKGLKGLGSGVEMAVKFPAAAGAAIGESLQKKPTMETLQKFGEAMAPTATDYLSKKFGLEDLIQEKEKELLEKRPGAVTVGNIIELGAELVPPATGYLKLIEDSSSKLYKVIRDGQAGKKVDPKDVEEVLELLSDKGVSRRDFLSIVGGTSIYALAKHIGIVDAVKISQKIKPVRMLSKSTTKMPEWFPSMIEKVLDDTGNSIFKQIDEDAVLITNKEMPGIEITKYDNGRLEVLGENNYGAKYYIEYDPAKYLDDGTYFPGDFSATDTRFYSLGPDDYTKENEIVDQVDDIFGGTDKMREYATGQKKKKLTSGEKEAIEAELRAESFTDEID
jgi:hypothetical protein